MCRCICISAVTTLAIWMLRLLINRGFDTVGCLLLGSCCFLLLFLLLDLWYNSLRNNYLWYSLRNVCFEAEDFLVEKANFLCASCVKRGCNRIMGEEICGEPTATNSGYENDATVIDETVDSGSVSSDPQHYTLGPQVIDENEGSEDVQEDEDPPPPYEAPPSYEDAVKVFTSIRWTRRHENLG